jgi:hypothetical protein
VEVVRALVKGVQPGCRDDVDIDLGVDALDARDVAAEPDHCGIDDGVDAGLLEGSELLDRVGDPLVLVPPLLAIVLQDLRARRRARA